jgi:DNA-binding GntR family transcriptional regulator
MNDFNSTIIEKIYNILKKRIINLEFKFNQKLNVKEIAQQFGVSQTPIRDALNNLVKDELVFVKPRVGYFIIKFTKDDLCEIYEVRKMIECFALENTINLNNKKFKKYYEKALKIKDKLSKFENYDEFNILDRDVHLSIIEESRNKQLIKIYFRIYSFVQISQNFDKTSERSLKEIDSIILLLEKILNKDILNAKTILREHIEICKIIGIESLKKYNIK